MCKRNKKREQKAIYHFYFPEASKKGETINICEAYYIDTVLLKYIRDKKCSRKFYAESDKATFEGFIKNKSNINDLFYIILDTDFSHSDNTEELMNKIRGCISPYVKEAGRKNKNLKVILSSRAFETYICFYRNNFYCKPYSDMKTLIKDTSFEDYQKTKEWYRENKATLELDLNDFINRIEKSRRKVFEDNNVPDCIIDDTPDCLNDKHLRFLCDIAPYTYFDKVLKDLM